MQYRTLESLCKIASGGTPSRSKKEYWDGGDVPWIKIGNIKSKVVSNADEYITEAGLNNSSAKLFKKGTILYTIFATLGEVGILDFDACTNQAIAGVSIEKPEEITADYLYYYLKSKKAEVNKIGRGIAQNNINLSILRKFLIPMRAIEEQKTIVNSLNKIESIIEKQKQQLEQLNNLIKARFVEMFGDPSKGDKIKTDKRKIGEIATVTKLAGFEFTKYINYQEEGDIIMLRGLNCKNGHLVLDDIKWIDQAISDALPRSKLYKGDILMTYAGTIGDVAMVDKDNTYHLAPNVGKISINNTNEINPVFLTQLFLNTHDYIMSFASQVAQASINMQKIRDFDYYFPPIELQNQFATFVTQVDKSKFALQNSIINLMNLWYNTNSMFCERTYGEA